MNFTLLVLLFAFSSCFKAQNITIFVNDNIQKIAAALKPMLSDDPFTEIVTVGSNCLPKFRTQSFLKSQTSSNLHNGNYLFDWMGILNYSRLAEAVKNNLTGVFDQKSLEARPGGLYNQKYDLLFNHVYDHMPRFRITPQSFAQTYPSIQAKYVYLTSQTVAAFRMTQKTLYISYVYTQQHKQSDFINLLNSIRAQRKNNNFFMLVLVANNLSPINFVFDTLIEENLYFHQIDYYPLSHWHTEQSKAQWNRILSLFL
jgi:hypothetical protein